MLTSSTTVTQSTQCHMCEFQIWAGGYICVELTQELTSSTPGVVEYAFDGEYTCWSQTRRIRLSTPVRYNALVCTSVSGI